MEILHHYNEDHNTTSAKEIIPYILSILPEHPKSILDVGCGIGQWLNVFKDNKTQNVLGIDGSHVPKDKLMINSTLEFLEYDLRLVHNLRLEKTYDLVLNLEVAEHLPEENANDLINFLTNSGDIIIFSAAIIGQTGENHLNEQNPTYWKSKFSQRGYVMLDAFREYFWNNERVNWWYRQNMYLVVNEEKRDLFPFKEFSNFYVHPDLFKYKEDLAQSQTHSKNGLAFKLKKAMKIK
jgi:SAM-dependent methyltransferase